MRLWSVAVYLLLPYVVGNLIWRGVRYPAYWHRWPERFGFVEPLDGRPVIWIHAVSVGEVRSSAALINALGERFPDYSVLVTTMTPTGSDQVYELFDERVTHTYVAYDFPDAVERFLNRIRPSVAIIAETEFWPTLFEACHERGIPLFLVNVRLSEASLSGYLWVQRTARRMMANADLICAQTEIDRSRLLRLGVDAGRLHVTGNLKFDAELPDSLLEESRALRQLWGADRPVWIAASTHLSEERRVLAAFKRVREAVPDLLLILVPRHPERFEAVVRLCERRGYAIAQRSEFLSDLSPEIDVLIGDTMGELQRLYAAADVAFIGGSLVRRGGQNLLEACAVSMPVVFGPHMFHFEEISRMALERGAGRQIADVAELAEAVRAYLADPDARRAAGKAAHSLVRDNRGALEKTLALVEDELARRPVGRV